MRVVLLLIFPLLFFSTELHSKVSPTEKKHPTIYKQWRFLEGGDEEVLSISPESVRGRLSGPGLPEAGVEMEKTVVKIIPSPGGKDGIIVVGPDASLSQPYQAIRWFDLSVNEVKLCTHPKVYPTVQAALQDSKRDAKYGKTYHALHWGI